MRRVAPCVLDVQKATRTPMGTPGLDQAVAWVNWSLDTAAGVWGLAAEADEAPRFVAVSAGQGVLHASLTRTSPRNTSASFRSSLPPISGNRYEVTSL